MATETFPAALRLMLGHEGGVSDHPDDPGGLTARGVTQRTYNAYRKARGLKARSVRSITEAEIESLYKADYWDAVRADELPKGVDYCTFDAAVNSGPRRAAKWLQAAVGVKQDGKIGPITMAAVLSSSPRTTIRELCDERMAFLLGLKTWKTFGKGWSRRVNEVEAAALQMASALPVQPRRPDDPGPSHDPISHVPAADQGWLGWIFAFIATLFRRH